MDSRSWSPLCIAGLEARVFEPAATHEHGYVVVFLDDGVSRNGDHDVTRVLDPLAAYGLRAVCPAAFGAWWTDRPAAMFEASGTPERHLVESVRGEILERWQIAPPQIALLGHRMGGQAALRIAYKYPDLFPIAAAIAPAIDFHHAFEAGDTMLKQLYGDSEDARQDTATLHIHPLYWPRHQWFCCDPADSNWFNSSDRLRMKLSSLGVPFECDLDTSVGSDAAEYFDRMLPAAFEFLLNRLEQERLRV